MNSSSLFCLRLFGSPAIAGKDGAPLSGRAAQRHRLALLALLARSPGWVLSRDKLMAYLWPENDTDRGRNLLNVSVYVLRRAVGEEALLSSGDELRLNPEIVRADVVEFEAALERGELASVVALYKGPFLDGFFLSEAPEFERWMERERERLAGGYARALEALAEAAVEQGDLPTAVEWWKARAVHDRYDSRVALRLMQALDASGNRAGALQHAAMHKRLVQEELGIEPAPEVLALAERLRSAPVAGGQPEVGRRDEIGTGTAGSTTLPLHPLDIAAVPPAAARTAKSGDTAAPFESASRPTAAEAGMRQRRPWPARQWATALGLLGLGGLAMLLAASWLRQLGSPTLHPQRVFVAPFENRTGDPALDPLGSMAADWIAQSLSRTADVEVVTTTPVLAPAGTVPAVAADNAAFNRFGTLAEETGAALLVSGAFYRQGDSLQFHTQITDARERRLLRALEPVSGAAEDPTAAVEALGRRTGGALAVVLDTRLAAIGNLASQPSNVEAYYALLEGLERNFAGDLRGALEHYERALVLDSSYLFPVTHIGFIRLNLGEPAAADSIAAVANRSRERMTPFERALLDLLIAYLGEDPIAKYEAAKQAATLGPGSAANVGWGTLALQLNRPREAIRILSAIDPTGTAVGRWSAYWATLTAAHHALGWHRRELRQARRARALRPDEPWALLVEGRALAALGRLDDLERVIAARRSLPHQRPPHLGPMLVAFGHELRVHGRPEAAGDLFGRAITWYRTRAAEEQLRPAHRTGLGFALLAAEQLDEAGSVFRDLAIEDPGNMAVQGVRGVLAARRGDVAEAERIAGWLANLKLPYHNGRQIAWRACIAAHLGDLAGAVSLLQEAAGRAAYFEHTHFCLDPLRDYSPFRELLRPKG